MSRQSQGVATPFYQAGWFWLALLLGPAVSYLLSRYLGGETLAEMVWEQWRLWLWLICLYPVIEEWVFRGLLQAWLWRRDWGQRAVWGFSLANGATSLCFVLAHLLTQPPQWAVLVIFPSLIFGWFRDRYGSVTPAILLHSFYNLCYFTVFGLPL